MVDVVGKRKFYITASAILVVFSLAAFIFWGLELGIDFTGGTVMEIDYGSQQPTPDEVRENLAPLQIGDVLVQPGEEGRMLIKLSPISEEAHQQILSSLQSTGEFTELRFDSIGPTIGSELQRKAIQAIIIVITFIVLYVAWAFRKVSSYISSWKYGVVTIIALLHDIIIPTGIVATLGHFGSFQIDSYFIAALLTILGFSVQDTIVVFDRLRENLATSKGLSLSEAVNKSINEVMARSINTSLTVLLVLISILLLGGSTVRNLVIVLILGTIFGAYSSIFVASPLLASWAERGRRVR